MRKLVIAVALTATASVSFAAMGSGLGLPKTFTFALDRGYGAVAVAGGVTANERNGASAMCVDCHTVNPSSRVMDLENNGAGAIDRTLTVNGGSHFVMNLAAGGAGSTNSGGGHSGSVGNAARDGGQFLRGGNWAAGGTSKFGNGVGFVSALEGAVTTANADIICESCHNLVTNVRNSVNDNDLLLGAYADNAEDGLCTGCHAQNETVAAGANRVAFHTNSNIKNFGGTVRKSHHVMNGDSIAAGDYPADGVSGTRWAPSYTTIIGNGWCTPANKFNLAARGSSAENPVALPTTPSFRNECNIAGSGTRASTAPVALGDIAIGAAGLTCSSCHRPHNAKTGAGAHVFRMGDFASRDVGTNAATADYAGSVAGANALFTDATLTFYRGLRRQSDVTDKVYGEYRALCLGCHIGY